MTTFIGDPSENWRAPGSRLARATRAAGVAARIVCAVVLLLPVYAMVHSHTGLGPRLVVAGFLFATLRRPADGLLLCAAFLAIPTPVALLLGGSPAIGEPLVLAFLGGWLLHEAVRPGERVFGATRPLLVPAVLLAAVVAASGLVQMLVSRLWVDYPWPFVYEVFAYLATRYPFDLQQIGGIANAAFVLEGIGLFAAVIVLCRRDATLTVQVARAAVMGAIANAAFNLNRFGEICLRSGTPLETFFTTVRSVRINAAFSDWNAAGSYFAMMLLVAIGLAVRSRRIRSVWLAAASLLVIALCLTGSRTALVALPAAAVLLGSWSIARTWRLSRRRAVLGGAAIAVLAGLLLVAVVVRPTFEDRPVQGALQSRVEYARTALRMTLSHPVFGVGVGRFFTVSDAYLDPEYAHQWSTPRENAHNSYLQVLAEIGLVGFTAFLWMLVVVIRRSWAGVRAGDRFLEACAAGLVVFLATAFLGNSLLIREVSCLFWIVLGVVAARSLEARKEHYDRPPLGRRARLALVAVIIGLAVSVPIRAHWTIQHETDLTDASIGFSKWQVEGGLRYRTIVRRAQFYVPRSTCDLSVPMRLDSEGPAAADVEVRIDGQLANRIRVVRGEWREARAVLRIDVDTAFRQVDLSAPGSDAVVQVGRPEIAACTKNPY